jgi:hypothetical protein
LIPSALPEIVAVLGKLEAVLTPPTLTIGSFASQFRIWLNRPWDRDGFTMVEGRGFGFGH